MRYGINNRKYTVEQIAKQYKITTYKKIRGKNQLLLFVLESIFGGIVGAFVTALCIAAKYGDKMKK